MVDDHQLMAQAYGTLLNTDPDIEIVGFAPDGKKGVEMAKRLQPDVVILDGRMPQLNGVDAANLIKQSIPEIGLILFSAFDDLEFIETLLAGGASGKGYLLKQSLDNLSDLVDAVKQVHAGKTVLAPEIADILAARHRADESLFAQLTDKEKSVIAAMSEGLTNAAIGRMLNIKPKTVENYVRSIYSKYGMHIDSTTDPRVSVVLRYLSEKKLLHRTGGQK